MIKEFGNLAKADLKKKTVIVRADLNVPIENGEIKDDTKIKALIPTLQHLIKEEAKIIILGHLGDKAGEVNDKFSLMPIRFEIGKHIQKSLKFVSISNPDNSIKYMEFGDVLLIENLFFSKEEFSKDSNVRKAFVENISKYADAYIYDCFTCEDNLASTTELPQIIKKRFVGLGYAAEVDTIAALRGTVKKPYTLIFGGHASKDKVKAIQKLAENADNLLIGGELAYTFLSAMDVKVGKSEVNEDLISAAKKIITAAEKKGCQVILPIDHIVAKEVSDKAKAEEVSTQNIPAGMIGLDIGPKTLIAFREVIEASKTILWYGPMGLYENENFNKGTEAIGEYIALSTPKDAFKVVAGDATVLSLTKLKIKHKRFSHASTAGDEFLRAII